jgi:3-oxoacyl-(acyl-carrier-protein) synthase
MLKKYKKKRVVITGIGPLSSIGIGKDDFWQGILRKRNNLKLEKQFVDGKLWSEFYCHRIEGFDISKFDIDKNKLAEIKSWKDGEEVVDLNYLIAAIKLALDDSNLDYEKENNGIGLVLTHENLGLLPSLLKISGLAYDMLIDKKAADFPKISFYEKFYYRFLKSAYDIQSFANLFHVAKAFNVREFSLFINNACASGLYALETASQIIKNNQARAVVVAASDQADIYKYIWFRDLGIYSADGIIRPFCKDSNGLVFGDGGAGVVLEDFSYARERNAPIYAEYLGGGFDMEGWKITLPQIGSGSYQRAISSALENSNTAKQDIDLLCPHGVGSAVIDAYEAKAITDIFGKSPQKPLLTAFKPYMGHNLGGSALLETIALLLSLKNNLVPPVLNCDNINNELNISLVKEQAKVRLQRVMKTCCAFAGYNAAAVFANLKE